MSVDANETGDTKTESAHDSVRAPVANAPLRARALIIGAALFWSTGGAAIKLSGATASQLAIGRALIAALVLYASFKGARTRWTKHVLITSLFYAATCTLYVFANTLTTAGSTIFIQNTAPIWVLIFGPYILREHATRAEKISVPISLLGCLLFFLDDMSGGRLTGNLCAAAASITYALLIISYRRTSADEGLAATVLGNILITFAFAWPAFQGPTPDAKAFVVFIYLGTIQQALSAVLFVRGIRGVSAMEGALLTLFEPLLAPVWAFLFVGETLGPLAIGGALLILSATVWRVIAARRQILI